MTAFSPPGERALVTACRRARRRRRHHAALLRILRGSLVYLKHASDGDDGLIFVCRGRVLTSWLCVYSSLEQLRADLGWPDWRAMPGSVLLDLVLPEYGQQRGPDRHPAGQRLRPPDDAASAPARGQRRGSGADGLGRCPPMTRPRTPRPTDHPQSATSTGATARQPHEPGRAVRAAVHDLGFAGWFLAMLTAARADSAASTLARAYRARRRQDTSR